MKPKEVHPGGTLEISVQNFFHDYLMGQLRQQVLILYDEPVLKTASRLSDMCTQAASESNLIRTDVSDQEWPAVQLRIETALHQFRPTVVNFYNTRYLGGQPLSQLWLQEHLRWHIQEAAQYRLARDLSDQLVEQLFAVPGSIISRRNRKLLDRIGGATRFVLQSDLGTNLTIELSAPIWENCNGFPAHQYELPAGEIASKPLTASGMLVLDGALNGTIPVGRKYGFLSGPRLRLEIEGGLVCKVHADAPRLLADLEFCFFHEKGANRLSEFGIGTHPQIKMVPGLDYAWEERCLGPHLGFGIETPGLREDGSISETGHHLDLILPSTQLIIDGKKIRLDDLDS